MRQDDEYDLAHGAYGYPCSVSNKQPTFPNEDAAKSYLKNLLIPYFRLADEVILKHKYVGNKLRIDFLACPDAGCDFPFDLFGVEVKASTGGIGNFNKAIKQSIDYTNCEISDNRELLKGIRGESIEYVYVFPAPACEHAWHGGSERLAGLFHVGLIYTNRVWGSDTIEPKFCMSSDRQWSPSAGRRAIIGHTRKRVGSGVIERIAT